MIGYAVLTVVMLVMKVAPQSPLGRWLNRTLVERPQQKIATMDRRHVMMLMILAAITLFATDMVFMFGSYDLLTLYAWDLSTYLDVMVLAYALAGAARARATLRSIACRAAAFLRRLPRARAKRLRASAAKPRKRSDNDDEGAGAWALAA